MKKKNSFQLFQNKNQIKQKASILASVENNYNQKQNSLFV
jgi:hypothetical protein